MFQYDPQLLVLVQTPPKSIPDLVNVLEQIDALCVDGDGLKWFNHLYLNITRVIQARVEAGGFLDPAWLRQLDIQFGTLYYSALKSGLTAQRCPSCWQATFVVRNNVRIARIQFALAGANSHINHDLPEAIIATANVTGVSPAKGTPQEQDYLSLNPTLEGQIDQAKADLHVRLLGDPLPAVSHVESLIAAWGLKSARAQAWDHAEALWATRNVPLVAQQIEDGLDGLTTFGNKALLVPAP